MNTKLQAVLAAVAAVVVGASGQAAVVSTSTLADLLAGVNTLQTPNGSWVWGGWSAGISGPVNPASIQMTAEVVAGPECRLIINGPGLVAAAGTAVDIGLGFNVGTVVPGSLKLRDAGLFIVLGPVSGGQHYSVDESLQDTQPGGFPLPTWTRTLHADNLTTGAYTTYPLVDKVYVVKDIMIAGGLSAEARLTTIYQTFSWTVPEPSQSAAVMLLGMVGGMVFLRNRRS